MTLKNIVENKILEHFTPATVLVNNKQDIVYLKGNTSAYLEPVEGIANMNLIEMAKPDIRIKLSVALRKAIRENKKVIEEKLHIKTNNTYKFITIQILPVDDKNQESNLFLVVFEDIMEKEMFLETGTQILNDKDKDYIKNLELELKQTKAHLQSVIEDSETRNEELKATNEEFESSNEELQSTNEELETSKEELQSINEELITLNNEHQNKIGELWDKNNDISNLLKNTEIATIFLDLDLKIKMFTPRVTDFINLVTADIGRPIENFSIKLNYPEFLNEVEQVLNTSNTIEKEVEGIHKSYVSRIMPYRTLENVSTGVVITLVEVTKLKKAEQKLREYKNLLEKNGSIAKLGVWDLDLKTNEIIWSDETYKIFELTKEYKPSVDTDIKFYHPEHQQKLLQLVENAIANGEPYSLDLILISAKGNEIWVRAIGEAIVENGEITKISGTIQNINEQKLSSEALKQSETKYRQLFQYSPNSIIIHDLEMNIMDINDQAIAEFGYSKEEFFNKNVIGLHPKEELRHSEEVLDTIKKKESLIENKS
jgi:two-component system CheB/CheR fusion protein